jgi:hypothetical protein
MVKRVKNILGAFPFIGRSLSQKGTISTASPSQTQKAASAFVKRRKQLGGPRSVMPVKKAMGGQAQEGAAKAEIRKGIRDRKRKKLRDMIERLKPGGPRLKPKKKPKMDRPILPKDKPKKDPIRPILPKKFKKPKMVRG